MIIFENKPSTKTPINDKNLNANFSELEDALYYKDGDTYKLSSATYFNGQVSGGATQILFSIPLPKRLNKIKDIIVNSYDITIRKSTGGYALNRETQNFSDIKAYIQQNNLVSFVFTYKEALDVTNNTPCGIAIYGLDIIFNE